MNLSRAGKRIDVIIDVLTGGSEVGKGSLRPWRISPQDRLLKAAERHKKYVDLIIMESKSPNDEKIKTEMAENRRQSQAAETRSKARGDKSPIKELEACQAWCVNEIKSGCLYKEQRFIDKSKKLLKTAVSHKHVLNYRFIKSQIEIYQKALREIKDKDIAKEVNGFLADNKKLLIKYDELFKSTKQGRALLTAGCI